MRVRAHTPLFQEKTWLHTYTPLFQEKTWLHTHTHPCSKKRHGYTHTHTHPFQEKMVVLFLCSMYFSMICPQDCKIYAK